MTEAGKPAGFVKGIENAFAAVTEKGLKRSLAVVLLTGLFSGAANYLIAGRMALPSGVALGPLRTVGPVVAIVTTLAGFGFSVVVYHGASLVLGGRGGMRRMASLAGYSSFPLLVQSGVKVAYYFLVNDPSDLVANGAGVVRFLLNYFTVFSVAAILLAALAVKENYGVGGRKALVVALLPTLVLMGAAFALRGFRL